MQKRINKKKIAKKIIFLEYCGMFLFSKRSPKKSLFSKLTDVFSFFSSGSQNQNLNYVYNFESLLFEHNILTNPFYNLQQGKNLRRTTNINMDSSALHGLLRMELSV